ncbi:MAG TPA: aminopeptidase [Chryseolinea sp.]|nr:aminopeptidase [Chryseolinea sp.]
MHSRKRIGTALAKEIVENTGIQPGEVVVVNAGQHNIPLLEAIVMESNSKGAFTNVFFTTDEIERALAHDVHYQHLLTTPTYFGEWVKNIDVWIGLSAVENPQIIFKDALEVRMVALRSGGQKLYDGFNKSKCRVYFVNYPKPEEATLAKMEFPVYEKMIVDAMQADYTAIVAKAQTLANQIKASKSIKVTSPDGTMLTLSASGRPVYLGDGLVSKSDVVNKTLSQRMAYLPDGRVSVTGIETSASGKVVVPRAKCRFEPMTNIRFDVVGGKMQNITVGDGKDCAEKILKENACDKSFASISIGLNPLLTANDDYWSVAGAGVVYLSFGNNQLEGGKNTSAFSWSFPIINATVEIDGKVVVKDGKVVM